MLQERYFKSWTAENVWDLLGDKENKELLSLAKEVYAEEFKTFCKESEDEEENTFEFFVGEVLNEDEESAFIKIMEAYAAKYNIKAACCSVIRDFDLDYAEFWITQIVPTSKKDMKELKELYEEYTKDIQKK